MFSRHLGVTFLLALLCAVVMGKGATVPELNDPEGQVVRLEYFFDQDPGQGNGISLDFSANEQGGIELNLDLPLDELSAGMHQLFIRAQNGRNEWSIASKQLPKWNAKLTGTAFPICRYCADNEPAKCHESGKVCKRAYSRTVNGRVSSG